MTESLTARDRAHVKFCRDTQCVIKSANPGHNCKNLDFTLDQVEKEAGDGKGLTGEARRERFIVYGETSLVCQDCDTNVTMIDTDPFLPVLTEAARDHRCDPEQLKAHADWQRLVKENSPTKWTG